MPKIRKEIAVVVVLTEKTRWEKGESFGEFIKRIRTKYEELTGNRRITVIVP